MDGCYSKVKEIICLNLLVFLLLSAVVSHAENVAAETAGQLQRSVAAGEKAEAKIADGLKFLPDVVAVVGEQPIPGRRVEVVLYPMLLSRLQRNSELPDQQQLKQIALRVTRQLVDQELLFKECRDAGYYPDIKEVRKKVEKLKNRLGEERFEEILESQRLSISEFHSQTANTIALTRWMNQEVYPHIEIDSTEIKEYYENHKQSLTQSEQVEVSHILLTDTDADSSKDPRQLQEKANSLAEKINNGETSFSEAAKKYSQCPSSLNGGRLSAFGRGEMVREFEKTAFNTSEGEISSPVVTEYGVHLIKVHKHYPEKELSYNQAKAEITQGLRNRKANRMVQEIIEERRQDTSTEILFKP